MTKEELTADFEKEFDWDITVSEAHPELKAFILKAFEAGEQAERERIKKDINEVLLQEYQWCEKNNPEAHPGFMKGIKQAMHMLSAYFSQNKTV